MLYGVLTWMAASPLLRLRPNMLTSHMLRAKPWHQGSIRAQKRSWSALVFSHFRTFCELSGWEGGSH